MIETHDFDGFWWLPVDGATGPPADASKRLTGRLRVTRGRAELDVLGHFGHAVLSESEDQVVYSPVPADVARILGLTTKGKPITLERCGSTASSINFPGVPTTTYRADAVLIGAWFEDGEEVNFDEFALRTTELDTWIGVSGFEQKLHTSPLEGGLQTATGIDIHFKPPEPITVALDNGEEVRLSFSFTWSGPTPVTVEASITQRASLHLRYAEPRGFDDVARSVGQLRNFLSLAVGRPVTVLSVTGYKDDFKNATGAREPITVLWEVPHNPATPSRGLHPTEMLFLLPDAHDIGSVLRSWFRYQGILQPVFNLFFSMLYHPDIYRDVHFLLWAQAVETYDSRRRIRDGLSGRRVLAQRIRDVLDDCGEVADRAVGSAPDERDAFVKKVVDSRNYYTHYNPKKESAAATGAELYLVIVQLRAIIETSLLREIGFSTKAVDHILDQVQRYAEIQHFKAVSGARTR